MIITEYSDLTEGMRAGMRRMAQGVTLLSALDAEGQRCVMTASAVISVSAEPPSMLVCVNRSASLFEVLSARLRFCVNVLSRGMEDLSNLCAGAVMGEERFELGDWQAAEDTGLPYLRGAEANFFCCPVAGMDHGTHVICVANIEVVFTRDGAPNPLLYVAGNYAGVDRSGRDRS